MIDSHVHLFEIDKLTENIIGDVDWSRLNKKEIEHRLSILEKKLAGKDFEKSLIYILDESDTKMDWNSIKFPSSMVKGIGINPLRADSSERILGAKNGGFKFIKILPYEYGIMRNHYPEVLNFAKMIEEQELILSVCCSYGSRYVYDTNGVELTAYLLNNGIKAPIIMAHGGMLRVFDAMSLMLDVPNLYMDLSFTLHFWKGSRVLDDYAFALKKLDYERTFYGSDFPYVDLTDSINCFNKFCKDYDIDDTNKQKMLKDNFYAFLKYFCKGDIYE